MLIVEGWVRFAPGEVEKLIEAGQAMVAATRAEEGCLAYSFARDINDPDVLRIAERWTDQAALEAHMSAPHTKAFSVTLGAAKRLDGDVRLYAGDEVRRII